MSEKSVSDESCDSISTFYEGRSVFFTGATGFLGTSYLSTLLLRTPVFRVYALVRGGESRLWKTWASHLPAQDVEALQRCDKIRVFDGNITLENFGLQQPELDKIRNEVSVFVHAASTISLKHSLSQVGPVIIQPSVGLAKLALTCTKLARFVYISTAYASAFLRETWDGNVTGFDAILQEDITHIRSDESTALAELSDLETYGTTPEYNFVRHPFAYTYAKHLAERLLRDLFRNCEQESKLLIFRPSCIGPAESYPYPFFEIPGSCPVTSFLAGLIASPPVTLRVSSHMDNPLEASVNEIPVDLITNRLLVHVARGTAGVVHAVSHRDNHFSMATAWGEAIKLRRVWWGTPRLRWNNKHWKSETQCALARLYVIIGCSFTFEDGKTKTAWAEMNSVEQENWPLWSGNRLTDTERVARRKLALSTIVDKLLSGYLKLSFLKAGYIMDL